MTQHQKNKLFSSSEDGHRVGGIYLSVELVSDTELGKAAELQVSTGRW